MTAITRAARAAAIGGSVIERTVAGPGHRGKPSYLAGASPLRKSDRLAGLGPTAPEVEASAPPEALKAGAGRPISAGKLTPELARRSRGVSERLPEGGAFDVALADDDVDLAAAERLEARLDLSDELRREAGAALVRRGGDVVNPAPPPVPPP